MKLRPRRFIAPVRTRRSGPRSRRRVHMQSSKCTHDDIANVTADSSFHKYCRIVLHYKRNKVTHEYIVLALETISTGYNRKRSVSLRNGRNEVGRNEVSADVDAVARPWRAARLERNVIPIAYVSNRHRVIWRVIGAPKQCQRRSL
ncbi:hypothetical protein EVAR_16082_1 [Eumeta japonica]|uniref:Uncharacterized protein n=1 Tax=Eumeta variegata TaxID=151549 RepID=A0A4C1UID2_EUMVA|nr:hypothetical protein EVAR_16082_1 [Eumeta japonica]